MITREAFMNIIAMYRQGLKIRKISRLTGKHRDTIKKCIEENAMPSYHKNKQRESILSPFYPVIDDYLEQDDYQATWIHERLKRMGYTGSYGLVKKYVHSVKEKNTRKAYIRFETEPGLQAQVDWGDFQIQEVNGKISTVYAFMLVLGFSRTMYVEFVRCCTLETFMDCHIHAFHYLGGVPAEILYDNMKNVVLGRENGRGVFNVEFLHFAHHYMFQPRLCPPYSPWVKGKVERPVDYLRERFWRGYAFNSVEQTNKDAFVWFDEIANRRIHGTHHQPVFDRQQQELPFLGKLPPGDYDTSLKVFRKVYKDCQLSYDANRYEVPPEAVGKKVMLKIKNKLIRIYHDQDLLVTFEEPATKYNVIFNPAIREAFKNDKEQMKRKYGNFNKRTKGKATRGLVTKSLYPDVSQRPLSEYDKYAQGGVVWNN